MMSDIFVGCGENVHAPEIQISGAPNAMSAFGRFLRSMQSSCLLDVSTSRTSGYPVSLPRIALELTQDDTGRLNVALNEDVLMIAGSNDAFEMLGRSLEKFFDESTTSGEHFHFDYYEGNPNLNETNCCLIFMCDR
jgi:hypothetical protein